MKASIVHFILVCVVSTIAVQISTAQTMYKCGASYQDKPCANGQTGKVIVVQNNAAVAKANQEKIEIEARCKRRGDEAQKIIWMREGGAQKNDLLAKADSEEQSKLIADVYAVRGNSNDIRANIEKSCMDEKEMLRKWGTLADPAVLKAAQELQQKINTSEAVNASKPVAVNTTANASESAMPVPKKKNNCANLKLQMEILQGNLAGGNDAQTVQKLNQQKRDLEKESVAANCH